VDDQADPVPASQLDAAMAELLLALVEADKGPPPGKEVAMRSL
jgi:hypothetical protein